MAFVCNLSNFHSLLPRPILLPDILLGSNYLLSYLKSYFGTLLCWSLVIVCTSNRDIHFQLYRMRWALHWSCKVFLLFNWQINQCWYSGTLRLCGAGRPVMVYSLFLLSAIASSPVICTAWWIGSPVDKTLHFGALLDTVMEFLK